MKLSQFSALVFSALFLTITAQAGSYGRCSVSDQERIAQGMVQTAANAEYFAKLEQIPYLYWRQVAYLDIQDIHFASQNYQKAIVDQDWESAPELLVRVRSAFERSRNAVSLAEFSPRVQGDLQHNEEFIRQGENCVR